MDDLAEDGGRGVGGLCSERRLRHSLEDRSTYGPSPSPQFDLFEQFIQEAGSGQGDQFSAQEGSLGEGFSAVGRLLQHPILGGEEERVLESGFRSVPSQPFHRQNQVSDADHSGSPGLHQSRGLVYLDRPAGRVSSNPCGSSKSQVPAFQVRGRDLPVQGPSLRPVCSPSSFYKGHGGFRGHRSLERHPDSSVSGRLVDFSLVQAGGRGCDRAGFASVSCDGDSDQFQEIQPLSFAETGLLGGDARHRQIQCKSVGSKDQGFPPEGGGVRVGQPSVCSGIPVGVGSHGLAGSARTKQPAPYQVPPVGSQYQVGLPGSDCPHSVVGEIETGPVMVDRKRQTPAGKRPQLACSGSGVLVRRLGRWMGSKPLGCLLKRLLGGLRSLSAYQRERTSGGGKRSTGLHRRASGETGGPLLRQHHSGSLSQEARGCEVVFSQRDSAEDSKVGGGGEHYHHPSVHRRGKECGGGRSISSESDSQFRVEPLPSRVQEFEKLLAYQRRPLRHLPKLQMSPLFLSDVGPKGSQGGRHATVLGGSSGLCFSSVRAHSPGSSQGEADAGSRDDAHSSILAPEVVVPGPSRPYYGDTVAASSSSPSSQTAPHVPVPREPTDAEPSCVEAIRSGNREAGFPPEVAECSVLARRDSTIGLYESYWKEYRSWCRIRHKDPMSPSIQRLAEYLFFLWKTKSRSVSYIKGSRSMFSLVFRHKLKDVGSNKMLSDIVRAVNISIPTSRRLSTSWDLLKVLEYLKSLEPLSVLGTVALTKKTLFLVALATCKRVGELQALSPSFSSKGNDVFVSYNPWFMAKTERADRPVPRSFCIKALAESPNTPEVGNPLCPVRALRAYVRHVLTLNPHPSSLFCAPNHPSRPLSKNGVSYWLRQTIKEAKAVLPSADRGPRAHDVRGAASSSAFLLNVPVGDILKTASWSSPTVFTDFYLKKISFSRRGMSSLGPFVSAGSVVNRST